MSEHNSEENILSKRKEFGEYLRQLREQHGLSIEGIAQETKIAPQFLRALESGTFEQLPGKVFGRGFIKNISRLVEADATDIVSRYESCWSTGAVAAVIPRAAVSSVSEKKTTKQEDVAEAAKRQEILNPLISKLSQNQIVIGFAVVVALVLVFVGYQRLTRSHETSPVAVQPQADVQKEVQKVAVAPPAVVAEEKVEVAVAQPDAQVEAAETPEQIAAANKVETHPIVPAVFEQVVEINVREPVTIKARIDGQKQEFWDLRKDVKKLTFQDNAELLISDGSAVDISFNNKSLGTLGSKGRMRRITFQAKAPTDLP